MNSSRILCECKSKDWEIWSEAKARNRLWTIWACNWMLIICTHKKRKPALQSIEWKHEGDKVHQYLTVISEAVQFVDTTLQWVLNRTTETNHANSQNKIVARWVGAPIQGLHAAAIFAAECGNWKAKLNRIPCLELVIEIFVISSEFDELYLRIQSWSLQITQLLRFKLASDLFEIVHGHLQPTTQSFTVKLNTCASFRVEILRNSPVPGRI